MKGLLIKDCQLLLQRRQTLLIFFGVCFFTGFSFEGSFLVGYMAFLSAIVALSTLTYDTADNGMLFLMTLPVSRRTYALSKYVLGAIFCLCGWALSLIMMFVIDTIKGIPTGIIENVAPSLVFLVMAMLVLDLMIPLQLRFGPEKSRIVMIVVFGGIAAAAALIMRMVPNAVTSLTEAFDHISPAWFAAAALLAACGLTATSAAASVRIMKKGYPLQ